MKTKWLMAGLLTLVSVTNTQLDAETMQTLFAFNFTNGWSPMAGFAQGRDGNLYGTTFIGGITNSLYSDGMGTIFKLTTNGTVNTLVYFAGTNGALPQSSLILGADGNFYGTTDAGGTTNSIFPSGMGTLFKVTTNGMLTTLVYFAGTNGAVPIGLMQGNDGNFYGTTETGGIINSTYSTGMGTFFKMTTDGALTTLGYFGGTNGAHPVAALVQGNDGNFYGTTYLGGNTDSTDSSYKLFGMGTVFKVTTNGMLTTLVYFAGTNGARPTASLTLGPGGDFYGTAGLFFRMTTNGDLTTLVNEAGSSGSLTLGANGNFYGTTEAGGNNGGGSVFRMTTNGTLTTLYSFSTPIFYGGYYSVFTNADGAYPESGLTLGPDGNFYGTTSSGGFVGAGVIYRLNLGPLPPHSAMAIPSLTNGFVVGINITDSGSGYTNTPIVLIIGGGGSGAQAFAVVTNGEVTSIIVTNAGFGYTNAPQVVIEPPFIFNPVLGIAPMSFLEFSNLTVGGSYQLQRSVTWFWVNQTISLTATDVIFTQMVAGAAGEGDYRLVLNPAPTQALATPEMDNDFLIGAVLTSGGSGYVTAPAVLIVGGGGTNATAFAQISGGVVTNIIITDAGFGYTNSPTIRIAQPPSAAVYPTVLPVMRLDSARLAPYHNYQIQFMPDIFGTWANWNGGTSTPTDVTNSQFIFITNGLGFFRLQLVQ